jgi:hypothetical protein
VDSADIIASLIALKKQVEAAKGTIIRLTLAGAAEAHLLAKEIGNAGVGVLIEQRPYPPRWEQKRLLPGPPLTQSTAITTLVSHNVTVGIMVREFSQVRNTRFDMASAELESNGALGRSQVLEMVSSNVETLLGVAESNGDLVATRGGSDFGGKVIAIISSRQGTVHLV